MSSRLTRIITGRFTGTWAPAGSHPPSWRIWAFSAFLAALAVFTYESRLAGIPTPSARLTLPWPLLAVAFAIAELKVVQVHFRRETHSFSLSEFPAVIIPMLLEHHVMLRRNLLYTAITRAKRLCMLVGDTRAIERAIRRADAARRWTGLAERTIALLDARLGRTQVIEIE